MVRNLYQPHQLDLKNDIPPLQILMIIIDNHSLYSFLRALDANFTKVLTLLETVLLPGDS